MTEGERWTREVLAELRAARFAPSAWGAFLGASFRRSAARARERRAERRQTLGLGLLGGASWAAVGALGHPAVALAGGLWWAVVIVMLDWHLGMLERPDGTRVNGLGPANVLGVLRTGAVPLMPALDATGLAALLLAIGALDMLDGPLARRRDEVTRLGAWLDGTSDTIAFSVAAVSAARIEALPGWVAALVVARFALPWVATVGFYFLAATPPPTADYVPARLPGLVLGAGIALALLDLPGGASAAAAGAIGAIATFAVSAWRTRGALGALRPAAGAEQKPEAAGALVGGAGRQQGGLPGERGIHMHEP